MKKHNIFKTIHSNLVTFLLLAGIPVAQKLPLAVIHRSREVFFKIVLPPSSSDSLLRGGFQFSVVFKPPLVGNTPVCSKRKHERSGQERSMKSLKTL